MDERSTLRFRSNIYPTSTNGELINDRRFLASISDPEALAILWRYNGSNGAYLNALQLEQHEAAEPCIYAEQGDFPWGTPVGGNRVVCLCEKFDCSRYHECVAPEHRLKTVVIPQSTAAETQTKNPTLAPESRKAESSSQIGRGVARRNTAKPRPAKAWTEEENKRLISAYPKCTREALYTLFAYRDTADVDAQVARLVAALQQLSQRHVPKPAVKKQSVPKQAPTKEVKQVNGNTAQFARKEVTEKPQQRQAKRKRKKPKTALTTWTVEEDVLIRRNYPRFGSNTKRWSKQMPRHSKEEIEQRARFLGVRRK